MEDTINTQAATIDNLEKQLNMLKRTIGHHQSFKKDIADLQKKLKRRQDKWLPTDIVICENLPLMIVSRSFLAHFTTIVVLGNSLVLDKLKVLCNDQTMVGTLESRDDQAVLSMEKTAKLCLSNINMNATWTEWLAGLGVTSFITTLAPRCMHKSWKRQVTVWCHSTFGRVTDCTQQFHIFTQSQLKLNTVDILKHQRDAHTIINNYIWCSRKRRKPIPSIVTPLSVRNIGTERYPIYHIGGLLPSTILPHMTIATLGIGLTEEIWVIRKMSPIEICDAVDISHGPLPRRISIPSFLTTKSFPLDYGWWLGVWRWRSISLDGIQLQLLLQSD